MPPLHDMVSLHLMLEGTAEANLVAWLSPPVKENADNNHCTPGQQCNQGWDGRVDFCGLEPSLDLVQERCMTLRTSLFLCDGNKVRSHTAAHKLAENQLESDVLVSWPHMIGQ
jgi:hypothetical protein